MLGPRRLEELKRKMLTLGKTGKEGKERDALAEKRKRYKAASAEVHTPHRVIKRIWLHVCQPILCVMAALVEVRV